MTWSGQRKTYIIIGAIVLVLTPLFVWTFLSLNQPPTCNDGLQNGQESGIDCGGVCQQVCVQDVSSLETVWYRTFPERPGTVTGIALIENRNTLAEARGVNYTFTLFSNGVELDSKTQTVFLPAGKRTPVITSGLTYGEAEIDYVSFKIDEPEGWFVSQDAERLLRVFNERVERDGDSIKIFADVENNSFQEIYTNLDFVVVAYNREGNVLGYSTTFLEKIKPQEREEIFLTWRQETEDPIARIEIIPLKYGHGF